MLAGHLRAKGPELERAVAVVTEAPLPRVILYVETKMQVVAPARRGSTMVRWGPGPTCARWRWKQAETPSQGGKSAGIARNVIRGRY